MSQLLHGDCLDLLPTLEDHSIDMILCDLPYQKTAAKWDTLIPMDALWTQYKRLIKPRGAIVLTGVQPFTSMLIMSNPKWYRHCWVWDKGSGYSFQTAKVRPMQRHEDVVVFGRSGVAYHPQMALREKPRIDKHGGARPSVLYGDKAFGPLQERRYTHKYPTTIVRIPLERRDHIHPTQKPAALFEYLIKTYSLPGQTVLDNAAGSMTTAIAALRTGREYICIERDDTYFAKGTARVERERALVQQTPLMPQEPAA